jgi:hypothetical protein
MMSIGTITGSAISVLMTPHWGTKYSMTFMHTTTLVGCTLIYLIGLHQTEWMSLFSFLTLTGNAGLYATCMQSSIGLYPTKILATALGISCFAGQLVNIMSPVVAELEQPLPIQIVILLSMVGIIPQSFLHVAK